MARFPQTRLAVYPELHLCGVEGPPSSTEQLQEAAEPLDGPRSRQLAELAGDLGIWLVPGTVCERGERGELFNTAPVYSPDGRLVASYRKIFPWRPHEPYDPGDRFVVADLPGTGRIGISICYDAWFPEVARQLAWLGAEVIVNPVMTTTADRAQELVLARANAIVNQVFVVSVNTAGPVGTGRSVVVDPEGRVRAEAPDSAATVLTDVLDLDDVTRVRTFGTAGLNRMWDQFTDADTPIDLPLYGGRIDPGRWRPATG
ncbi:hydrolase [Streptomyces regensis]|nr:hydrolase [Streptomyces regensis]KOG62169.1 hydrolase [Streptomyces antibioticus]KOV90734.1 hydrolase [Streptomyces sp. NRRL WC-3723]